MVKKLNMRHFLATIFLFVICPLAFGQNEKIDSIQSESLDMIDIEGVVVIYRSPAEMRKLRRDVLKAYPYALRAASIINQIDDHTDDIKKKRHKKRYLKKKEEILREQFEENLKKLTKTQGRYMVRLINRETNNTVYDLIKEYKNGLNAVVWQMIAKKFDSDLKSVYDPENMESIDFEIEQIIQQLSPYYVEKIKNEITVEAPTYRDFQR